MKKPIIVLFFASLLFTIFLFFPYSVNITNGVTNVIDPLLYAWNISHNAQNIFHGMNSLLNTNMFYPLTNTIAYSDTLWGQSLITSPIVWITDNPILAENIAVLLSFPLSAISMYLLSFFVTKNALASFLSGMFFAFSYPRLSQIGHLPMISSQWLPLYILYLLKFLDEGKRSQFLFLCLWYVVSISCSIYFGVFLVPITAVIVLVDIVKRIRNHTLSIYKKRILSMFPTVIFFLIAITIVMFPYIRLKVEHPELKRSIDDMTHLRAIPVDYLSVLPTSIVSPYLPKNINEHVLYPTLSVLTLAALGVLFSWKRNRYMMSIFIILAITSLVLSLGDQQGFSFGSFSTGTLRLPYYYLYTYVPIFQTIRVPARFAIFFVISLSMLAAWGVDGFLKKTRSKWIIGILFGIFVIEIWQVHTPFVIIPLKNSIPEVYAWIQKQPEPMVLTELPVSLFFHGNSMENQLFIPYGRLEEKDTYALETYRVYFSAFHKKRMLNGYSGFLPDSYNKLSEALESFPAQNTILEMQDIGITHIIVHSMQYEPVKRKEILTTLSQSPLVTLSYENSNDYVFMINKDEQNL